MSGIENEWTHFFFVNANLMDNGSRFVKMSNIFKNFTDFCCAHSKRKTCTNELKPHLTFKIHAIWCCLP